MLTGERIRLRPIRSGDIDELWRRHVEIDNRGDFYPRGIASQVTFRKRFDETGLWSKEEGTLVIVDADDALLGEIEFFRTVAYLDEVELSYLLFDRASDGKGYVSEAVRLLSRYLFETRPLNRIRLVIHTGNAASQGVARKNGFTLEGTMRGAWFNRGRHHDVQLWSLLRDECLGPREPSAT
jgi:[ribosomal protein S5]-alanine N-acetyltransferase